MLKKSKTCDICIMSTRRNVSGVLGKRELFKAYSVGKLHASSTLSLWIVVHQI